MSSQISSHISNICMAEHSDCQELIDQIKVLISLQGNRDIRLLEQTEIQLSFFEQLQQRMDDVDRRLDEITRHVQRPSRAETVMSVDPNHVSLSGWQEQRDQMLQSLSHQCEMDRAAAGASIGIAEKPGLSFESKGGADVEPFATPFDASAEDLSEIDALKKQLNGAIREMELECSVLRAKLYQEKLRLEEKEAELVQREKNLGRNAGPVDVTKKTGDTWLFSRLKCLLGRH